MLKREQPKNRKSKNNRQSLATESQAGEYGWRIAITSQGKAPGENESHDFYLVRFTVHKEDIIMMNPYIPNNVNLKYIKKPTY